VGGFKERGPATGWAYVLMLYAQAAVAIDTDYHRRTLAPEASPQDGPSTLHTIFHVTIGLITLPALFVLLSWDDPASRRTDRRAVGDAFILGSILLLAVIGIETWASSFEWGGPRTGAPWLAAHWAFGIAMAVSGVYLRVTGTT
jgi:hypothetical protein